MLPGTQTVGGEGSVLIDGSAGLIRSRATINPDVSSAAELFSLLKTQFLR